MYDREYLDRIMTRPVDDSVGPLQDLADLRRRGFRDYTPGRGKDNHLLQTTDDALDELFGVNG